MRGPTLFQSRLVSFTLGFLIVFAGLAFSQAAPAPTAPQSETRLPGSLTTELRYVDFSK
jgi:hypothetical protein